jgi:hypothetical protein
LDKACRIARLISCVGFNDVDSKRPNWRIIGTIQAPRNLPNVQNGEELDVAFGFALG